MKKLSLPSGFRAFCDNERGSNAIEYCVIACTICIALIPIYSYLTGTVSTQFSNLSSHIASGK